MSKQIILLIIVIVIIALLGGGIYYFIYKNMFMPAAPNNADGQKLNFLQPSQAQLEQMKKDFPNTIEGIISFSGQNNIITDNNGKEWILIPPKPESAYYIEKGIKSGQKVKIIGTFLEDNIIQRGVVIPL